MFQIIWVIGALWTAWSLRNRLPDITGFIACVVVWPVYVLVLITTWLDGKRNLEDR